MSTLSATLQATTESEIPGSLSPLLNKARRKPVALSQNGKTVAFLVSVRTYQQMVKLAEMLEEAEDEYWVKEVNKARKNAAKNPPISEAKFQKLMDDILAS